MFDSSVRTEQVDTWYQLSKRKTRSYVECREICYIQQLASKASVARRKVNELLIIFLSVSFFL